MEDIQRRCENETKCGVSDEGRTMYSHHNETENRMEFKPLQEITTKIPFFSTYNFFLLFSSEVFYAASAVDTSFNHTGVYG